MECCAEHAVTHSPDVVCGDTLDGKPGPENDDVSYKADEKYVEYANIPVCDESWENTCGKSNTVEDDDEVERSGIRHVEGIAGERGNLC